MTKDDIIKLAREAGFADDKGTVHPAYQLEAFANLVAAHKAEVALAEAYRCGYEAGVVAEREECAKVCDALVVGFPSYLEIDERIQECAAAIRERGTT